ncbi:MAG: GerW family sporulation protein [Oscillospiraceae bacterium]|nr:GerW family sporulation protein [Oscillospiraceae bacterium]
MENKHPINEFSDSTVQKIRDMIDVNTIIGEPIKTPDGILIIPVSRVSLGFLSGGADWTKEAANNKNFSAGTGTGVTIKPVAFLVVKEGDVKLINVNAPANSTADRIVEIIPEVMDKVSEWTGKNKE